LTSTTKKDRSQETSSQREVWKSIKGTPDLENKTKKGPEEEWRRREGRGGV
jgi:hypothetical protein